MRMKFKTVARIGFLLYLAAICVLCFANPSEKMHLIKFTLFGIEQER